MGQNNGAGPFAGVEKIQEGDATPTTSKITHLRFKLGLGAARPPRSAQQQRQLAAPQA